MSLLALGVLGPTPAGAVGNIEGIHDSEPDRDLRSGTVEPTRSQRDAASELGSTVRWNRFGTPQSLVDQRGFLDTDLRGANAGEAARGFLVDHAAVFGLSADYLGGDDTLEQVDAIPMGLKNDGNDSYAVFFRQKFGGLPAVQDGSVTVGLKGTRGGGWDVAYVSSSLTKNGRLAVSGTRLSAEEAWRTAAQNVGKNFSPAAIETVAREDLKEGEDLGRDTEQLSVDGLSADQPVRLTALPTPEGGVRPAFEAILIDDRGGKSEAFTSFVDANTGRVLVRTNNVQQFADDTGIEYAQAAPAPEGAEPFQGDFSATSCEEDPQNGPFTVAAGTGSVAVYADATNPENDIVLQLFFNGRVVAEQDTGSTPESILYEPAGGVPAGDYFVRVCSYDNAAPKPPTGYTGFFLTNDAVDPPAGGGKYPPKWKYFFDNPLIGATPTSYPSDDVRQVECWDTQAQDAPRAGCNRDGANFASRFPWDVNPKAAGNPSTFTTVGNNARAAEAWYSPTAPGPTGFRPVSATRRYNFPFENAWYESTNPADPGRGCSPTELTTPGEGNDISAATTALFATHNRIHDWSYHRGFTERAYNLQDSNFGVTPAARENDPELGDAQAGAVNGGAPTYVGRDNANQLTLRDGIAPITNMYLWQPIAGSFYAPCVDGDFDVSIVAHEYGHAIQNRMVAGPDAGLEGLQARSMGESWSDLTAIEYLYEYGYEPGGGTNRYAVGSYATGDKKTGIRNYAMNRSPLNYSNIEYDPNGVTSPHSDGEIWSAANFAMRQLLMDKYQQGFPATPGSDLQVSCADGYTPSERCPGNVRWAEIYHSAFLLMPSQVSFLDARDAYLAADRLRYDGDNQRELWLAFARYGMGAGAKSSGTDDRDPTPSFVSPRENNAEVPFRVVNQNGSEVRNFEVYVGRYEARAVPVADGRNTTPLTRSAAFAPGSYDLAVRAPGYGLVRAKQSFEAGDSNTRTIRMYTNWAAESRGAAPTGSSDGTSGKGGSSAAQLLDETERTNWRADGPVAGKQVTVDLAGNAHRVDRVRVSALLRPQEESNNFGDTDTQGRFSALRQFEILTCNAGTSNTGCTNPNRGFTSVFTSPKRAETGPAAADNPRPTAPDLLLSNFDVRDTTATHVQLRVIANQCTGGPAYQGDPDADPTNASDCSSQSTEAKVVRAAELQVLSQ